MKGNYLWIVMVVIFGVYFIAEHGMLNWFVIYGTNALGLEQGKAANYMALFFGGMTVGRLVFSPAEGIPEHCLVFCDFCSALCGRDLQWGTLDAESGRTVLLDHLSDTGYGHRETL